MLADEGKTFRAATEIDEDSGIESYQSAYVLGGEESRESSSADSATTSAEKEISDEEESSPVTTESEEPSEAESDRSESERDVEQTESVSFRAPTAACLFVGLLAGILLYCYAQKIHECITRFSGITALEKELSLSPEAALHYSYYKQLLDAPSLVDGVIALTRDNSTEYPATLNLYKHMNIHLDVLVASVYRSIRHYLPADPVTFYLCAARLYSSLFLTILCCATYYLSGSIIAQVTCISFFLESLGNCSEFFNKITPWESFFLPTFCLQNVCLCYLLGGDKYKVRHRPFSWIILLPTTLLLCLLWPLGHTALAVQVVTLHWLAILGSISVKEFLLLCAVYVFATLVVSAAGLWHTQLFFLHLLFYIEAAYVSLTLFSRITNNGKLLAVFFKMLKFFGQAASTVVLTIAIQKICFLIAGLNCGPPLGEFLQYAVGYGGPKFDFQLLFKSGVFAHSKNECPGLPSLQIALFLFLIFNGCFEFGLNAEEELDESVVGSLSLMDFKNRLHLSFMLSQAVILFLPAQLFSQLQVSWNAMVAMLAACALSEKRIWRMLSLLSSYHRQLARNSIMLAVVAYSIGQSYEKYREVTMSPSEVFEPTKVGLMEWVKSYVPKNASFAGPPDIMAYVKCSTDRPIVVHPCLESGHVIGRARNVFQICDKATAKQVHEMLKSYDARFLIVSNEMCPKREASIWKTHGKKGKHSFDERLLRMSKSIRKYFLLAYVNKDYRAYKIL